MRVQVSRHNDQLHRPTVQWIERLSRYGDLSRIAQLVREYFPGREADGIYHALGILRYVRDETTASLLRSQFPAIEGDAEVLQSAEVLLRTRFGDCDDFTILGAAIAHSLGLPYEYVLHRDVDKPAYHHIYLRVRDARGWVPVDRVWGRGAGRAKPGFVVILRPKGETMERTNFSVDVLSPLTARLGQAEPAKSSLGQWFATNPVGQALTTGTAALISAFTGSYAQKIGTTPAAAPPAAPAVAPAAIQKQAFPVGLVVGGLGIAALLLFLLRRK